MQRIQRQCSTITCAILALLVYLSAAKSKIPPAISPDRAGHSDQKDANFNFYEVRHGNGDREISIGISKAKHKNVDLAPSRRYFNLGNVHLLSNQEYGKNGKNAGAFYEGLAANICKKVNFTEAGTEWPTGEQLRELRIKSWSDVRPKTRPDSPQNNPQENIEHAIRWISTRRKRTPESCMRLGVDEIGSGRKKIRTNELFIWTMDERLDNNGNTYHMYQIDKNKLSVKNKAELAKLREEAGL